MNKIDTFSKEYTYINNERYIDNLKKLVELIPDYFFSIQASSTGKYHPSFALNNGGLVRHTKVAAKIAYELYKTESVTGSFTSDEKDLMIFALILHDSIKHGFIEEEYTVFTHPLLAGEFIKNNKDILTLTENEIDFLVNVISSHMGPWNKDRDGVEVLPMPKNKYQKFVHMCDFLASRKFLDVKFNDNDIID